MFFSCEKNTIQKIDSAPKGAFVRFYNFALSGPSVNFYIDDAKISANSSATGIEATTGVNYGGIFPANNSYVSIENTGDVSFKTIVPSTATANPNVTIVSVNTSIEPDKYYSFFTSGVYNATTKTTSGFVVEDILPAVDTSMAYVRFVNTFPNNLNGFSLKAVNTNTLEEFVITAPISFQGSSAFLKVPGAVYNLIATSSNVPMSYTITRKDVSLSKGFVYTIASKGDPTVTTGANLPSLDLTRNR